jgi:hypothetical protein
MRCSDDEGLGFLGTCELTEGLRRSSVDGLRAEQLRMMFLAKGQACRRGGAREFVADLHSELRQMVVTATPADLLQGSQGTG